MSDSTPSGGQGAGVTDLRFEPREVVGVAMLGAGGRARSLLRNLLATRGIRVVAVCDAVEESARKAEAQIREVSEEPVRICGASDGEIREVLDRDDVDLVIVGTSWDGHTPLAVEAMEHGKHVGVEVPAATTLDQCWSLVRTSERTRRHCMMLENCCYGDEELLILNMVRDGAFGDLLHAEGSYIHDLRRMLLSDVGAGLWRRFPHTQRDGNLYPTHGLGPAANWLEINRGDRFERLVSMSSPHRGLEAWRAENVPADSPKQSETYVCGDMNTSLIKTARGLTITVQHDVVNPLPYSRGNVLIGTGGTFRDSPPRIYLERDAKGSGETGGEMGREEFGPLDRYRERYRHQLWRDEGSRAREVGGHGGMDFIMISRLIDCMHAGSAPDMDVYDAAALSAVGPLSEASVASGSAPVEFPDFTGGRWRGGRINLS
ncbi:MAG TPA: Gfo/Idh/MocA family oxidoreductase [Candidatus Dormibacteraeota bacterium]|jgi:hypothetical protein|nr:Gfo/Idh/MocA family oxidoreductase [Candidatus Dormibacteraeota bacterium]